MHAHMHRRGSESEEMLDWLRWRQLNTNKHPRPGESGLEGERREDGDRRKGKRSGVASHDFFQNTIPGLRSFRTVPRHSFAVNSTPIF